MQRQEIRRIRRKMWKAVFKSWLNGPRTVQRFPLNRHERRRVDKENLLKYRAEKKESIINEAA